MIVSFLTSPIDPETVFNFNTKDGVTAFNLVRLATSISKRQFKSVYLCMDALQGKVGRKKNEQIQVNNHS